MLIIEQTKEKTIYSLERLFLIYFITAILNFYTPIIVVFFNSNVSTPFEVSIILSFYSIARIITEFPSGIVADFISRKRMLQVGLICKIIAIVLIIFNHNFCGFLIAETLFGLADSIISGTDNAFLFDELNYFNSTDRYSRIVEKVGFCQSIALFFSFVICSLLCSINIKLAFYCSIVSSVISYICISLVHEHYYSKSEYGYKYILRKQIGDLLKIKTTQYSLLISSALSEAVYNAIYVFLFPLILSSLAIADEQLGIYSAFATLFFGVGCWFSKEIIRKERFIKRIIPLLNILMLYFIGKCNNLLTSLILMGCIRLLWGGLKTNFLCVVNTQINKSHIRASIISLYGCIVNTIYSAINLLIGKRINNIPVEKITVLAILFYAGSNILIKIGGVYLEKIEQRK